MWFIYVPIFLNMFDMMDSKEPKENEKIDKSEHKFLKRRKCYLEFNIDFQMQIWTKHA